MPRPFAILIAALLALYFVPLGALPASATEPTLTLQGCRGSAADFPANGPFVCPDSEYTTGNLQKLWNELDLVPFRVTSNASAGDTFPFTTTLAADYLDNGNKGYDVISVPVVNTALSDPSCQITDVGPQLNDQPSLGGSDFTIRRDLTWTQKTGTTCVFDYYQRLALGASKYPGSNLQAYLGVDNGKKTVPLPVGAILPQSIAKTMTATQGSTYAWTLEKSATPANVNFADTCEQSTQPKSAPVTITLDWTRSAKLASGDVLLTTKITATNPAHREITVNVTDKMYEGDTQTNLLATNTDSFDVPASGTHDFTFSKTVSSNVSTFNDVATATYTDKATGIPVPGNTTATAKATVADNGTVTGATATISDVESVTGSGFSYSVNSVTPNVGSFGGYTLGTHTTSDVTWSSTISPVGTSSASGSFVFAKTVYVAAGTVGSGTLADTATLTPAGLDTITKTKSVALTADAADPMLRITKKVDIAPTTDADFTFQVRAKDSNGDPTGPTYTFVVTIKAGDTQATSGYQTVAPSAYGYVYTESAASGYTGVNGSIKALDKCAQWTEVINNTRDLGKIKIKKVLDGDVAGATTTFVAHVDCPGTAYDQDVTLNEGNNWIGLTGDIPTGTQCTITEPNVPAGWELTSIDPSVVTVNKGTPTEVTSTITNTRTVGSITINKLLDGAVAGASTEFTVQLDCDGNAYDQSVVLNEANNWTKTYGNIPSGVKCTVTEPTVPAGWELKSIDPSGQFTVAAGQTVTVNVTNKRLVGSITINKIIQGDVAGASTEFTVQLDCDVNAYDKSVVLNQANNWTATIANIPSGVKCTVTEPTVPAGWELKSIDPSDEFTVVAGQTVTLNVTNERLVGSVTINKIIQGDVAGASTEFTVKLDCNVGDTYDHTVVLNEANNWTKSFTSIPSGVKCTVTEPTVPAGWELKSIDPSGEFTVGAGQAVTVNVTNKRLQGGVVINKIMQGDVAGASTDFTVYLDCDGATYDKTVSLNQANGWTKEYTNIPSGVTCIVLEPTVPDGWQLKSISPSGSFTIGSGASVVVDVTNERTVGSVEVKKVVVGDVAGASTDFSATLDCDGTAYDKTLALNAGNSWTAKVDNIPTLVQCQVTEPTVPAGWSLTSISPSGKFTIAKATTVSVTVTNTRTTGVITVTKVLDGAPNGASTQFTFDVDCPGTAYDQTVVVNVASGTQASATTKAIPTGLSCTVTERATPDWRQTAVVPAGGVVAVGSTVTFTNKRLEGTLNISKAVSPVAGNGVVVEFGDTLTYTLTVSATGEQRQPNVVVTDYLPGMDPQRPDSGKTTYVAGSAACIGNGECTVTGPDATGLITWNLGEMAAGTTRQVTFQVTIDDVTGNAGETVAVDIVNAGAVQSDRVPRVESNEVVTPVTKVLPIKIPNTPPLPHTGTTLPIGPTVGGAIALLGLGLLLVVASRQRRWMTRR